MCICIIMDQVMFCGYPVFHSGVWDISVYYKTNIAQVSKRSNLELTGRTDGNITVVFPNEEVISENGAKVMLKPGNYVHVKVIINCVCMMNAFLIRYIVFTDHQCYISYPPWNSSFQNHSSTVS